MANREGKKIRGLVKEINLTVYPDKETGRKNYLKKYLKKKFPELKDMTADQKGLHL